MGGTTRRHKLVLWLVKQIKKRRLKLTCTTKAEFIPFKLNAVLANN